MSQNTEREIPAIDEPRKVVDIRSESIVEDTTPETVWVENGYEFELDIGDAEYAEKVEKALANLEKAEKSMKRDGGITERILAYDAMFRSFYDDLFGPGGGDDVLGEKRSIAHCNEVYDRFLDFINKQGKSFEAQRAAISTKYAYTGNRAQRRAAAKQTRRS